MVFETPVELDVVSGISTPLSSSVASAFVIDVCSAVCVVSSKVAEQLTGFLTSSVLADVAAVSLEFLKVEKVASHIDEVAKVPPQCDGPEDSPSNSQMPTTEERRVGRAGRGCGRTRRTSWYSTALWWLNASERERRMMTNFDVIWKVMWLHERCKEEEANRAGDEECDRRFHHGHDRHARAIPRKVPAELLRRTIGKKRRRRRMSKPTDPRRPASPGETWKHAAARTWTSDSNHEVWSESCPAVLFWLPVKHELAYWQTCATGVTYPMVCQSEACNREH